MTDRIRLTKALREVGVLMKGLLTRPMDPLRIGTSKLLDAAYYKRENLDIRLPALLHFAYFGGYEGREPSPAFDTRYYLARNDLEGLHPVVHYLIRGRRAGARPKPSNEELQALVSFPPFREERVVVYTAIIGSYDELAAPAVVPPNCDFVCFSDGPLPPDRGWLIRPSTERSIDAARTVRYYKLNPHILFPDHAWSIWVDANMAIRGDLTLLISGALPSHFAAFAHPLRGCLYKEAEFCKFWQMDDAQVIARQVARYQRQKTPAGLGMTENNVLVRRHGDPLVAAANEAWWHEVYAGSRRDQLSLPYVAYRLGLKIGRLAPPGFCSRNHPLFKPRLHRHQERRASGSPGRFPAGHPPECQTA